MVLSVEKRLRGAAAESERWFRERTGEARDKAEALGRKVWDDGTRAGNRVLARTSYELRELGRTAMKAPSAKPATPPRSTPAVRPKPQIRPASATANTALRQGQAAVSGAVDEFTFGLADRGLAAIDALGDGGLSGFDDRYTKGMTTKRSEDAYDDAHYQAARNVGRAVGFAGSLAATGGFGLGGAAVKGAAGAARSLGALSASQHLLALSARAPRLAETVNATKRIANLSGRGLTTIAAGGGAAAGVTGQLASDLVSGRPADVSDYVGAALGGAVGGLAIRAGMPTTRAGIPMQRTLSHHVERALRDPRVAGAIEGGATTVFQALGDRRSLTPTEVAEAARGGAVGARLGDIVGKYGTNSLSTKSKGILGENLSLLKTRAGREGSPLFAKRSRGPQDFPTPRGTVGGPGLQQEVFLSRGKTIADHVTRAGQAVEAKFGRWADLSAPQRRARRELGDRYRIDHWLPSDIGRGLAIGLGPLGPRGFSDDSGT